jgi:hypothetical protein
MDERRKARRIIATELIYDINSNFLGVCLDVSDSGIRLTVSKYFPNYNYLSIQLKPLEGDKLAEITLIIQPFWRRGHNSVYDEIGAKIIRVEQEKEWRELLKWYAKNEMAIREPSFISVQKISVSLRRNEASYSF